MSTSKIVLPKSGGSRDDNSRESREVAERAVRLAKDSGSWESISARRVVPTWAEIAERRSCVAEPDGE